FRKLVCFAYPFWRFQESDVRFLDENILSWAALAFKIPTPKIPGNSINSVKWPGSTGGLKAERISKEGSATAVDKVILQTLSLGPVLPYNPAMALLVFTPKTQM
uniref:Uncharacterized protein n=1 Tax=Canis lupus familiaris TaxID=9615 RepID=A0A8C0N1Y8_CANLF